MKVYGMDEAAAIVGVSRQMIYRYGGMKIDTSLTKDAKGHYLISERLLDHIKVERKYSGHSK